MTIWIACRAKSYSDGTPSVTYVYDTVQKGCLSSVTTSVSTTAFTAYEPFCQTTASVQTPRPSPGDWVQYILPRERDFLGAYPRLSP